MSTVLASLGLAIGDRIVGKYRIDGVIASGGMGVVLAALHEQLGQPVAIKLMLPDVAKGEEAGARFRREASAAAQLRSDHVVRIYDLGQLDDGAPYIVMERLEGMSLERLLAVRGRLPVPEAVEYVRQTLLGLEEAHAAGIVHRDLKPQNLFVIQPPHGPPRVKILDFGISKLDTRAGGGPEDTVLTSPQAVLGTPAYIAPEQLESTRDADARADLWSIGAILHELLTGRMLFEAESVGAALSKVLKMPIPKVRDARDDVPAELDEVLGRCLDRDLTRRFASAAELRAALEPFVRDWRGDVASADTIPSLPPAPSPSDAAAGDAPKQAALFETSPPLSSTQGTSPRRADGRRRALPIAFAGLLLAGLAALAVGRTGGEVADGPASATAPASLDAETPHQPPATSAPSGAASTTPSEAASTAPFARASATAASPSGRPSSTTPARSASSRSTAPPPTTSASAPSTLDELELHRRQ